MVVVVMIEWILISWRHGAEGMGGLVGPAGIETERGNGTVFYPFTWFLLRSIYYQSS